MRRRISSNALSLDLTSELTLKREEKPGRESVPGEQHHLLVLLLYSAFGCHHRKMLAMWASGLTSAGMCKCRQMPHLLLSLIKFLAEGICLLPVLMNSPFKLLVGKYFL